MPPETFLDDITPIDGHARGFDSGDYQDERDPHELSLSPRFLTRASVVDNMLLSLDQFSNMEFSDEPQPTTSEYYGGISPRYDYPTASRSRGHTISSSLSSEPDFRTEDTRQQTLQLTRGRRSTSTSTFQTPLRTISNLRTEEEPSHRSKVYEAQRAMSKTDRAGKHTRGKSSKSSGSSHLDLKQILEAPRAPGTQRRSASFDLSANFSRYMAGQAFDSQDVSDQTSQRIQQSIDQAPEPTIPAGPRRHDSPVTSPRLPPPPAPIESNTRPLGRRGSTKSAKSSSAAKKSRAETLGTATIRAQEEELRRIRESLRELPPLPAVSQPERPPALLHSSSADQGIPQVKERPGFLKRVFGSSSRNQNSAVSSPSSKEGQSLQPPNVPRSQGSSRSLRQIETPPTSSQSKGQRAGHTSHGSSAAEKEQPVLQKKPSSFFRRRKKSVAEATPVPVVPVLSPLKPTAAQVVIPQSSPVSSLRAVMNPYLHGPVSQSTEKALLSPLGNVSPSQAQIDGSSKDRQDHYRASELSETTGPSSNLKVPDRMINKPPSGLGIDVNDDSFLADSSSYEGTSASSSPRHSKANNDDPSAIPPKSLLNSRALDDTSTQQVGKDAARPPYIHPALRSYTAPAQQQSVPDRLQCSPRLRSATTDRIWSDPDISDEKLNRQSEPFLPIEGVKASPIESLSDVGSFKSAPSTPQIGHHDSSMRPPPLPNPPAIVHEEEIDNSEAAMAKAIQIFDHKDDDHEHVCAWLGEYGDEREIVRNAFMSLFDWSNQNILYALRGLCARIALKGESQQVDRVLDAFARRWCDCNPDNGFKSTDVVHTICYSVLLLNTDLHLADIEQKMTKSQFLRNTMSTVRNVAKDSATTGFDTIRAGTWPRTEPAGKLTPISSPTFPQETRESRPSPEAASSPMPSSAKLTDRLIRSDETGETETVGGPLVSAPFKGSARAWEAQVETVLKSFYLSIARERLPLFGAVIETAEPISAPNNFLGVGGMLRRTPSTLSKATSEHTRGRAMDSRTTGRWTSKGRSRPRLHQYNTMSSGRPSFDDGSSIWTPSINSSTWSRASAGKTLTSMSVESFGSSFPMGEYQKSIGFANALSQAIIREDTLASIGSDDGIRETPLLEDESLELTGAPWAKEGLLQHKHHLDGLDKKSKDRNWSQCFAVIEKGWMRLFSFEVNAKTVRQRAKDRQRTGGPVGGGNWMDNAEEKWKFLLRQTIASALPPPGYSKQRPHVWALSLPTGAVHLFEVGTPEIVKEFVSTANYWSARMSKEPLFGGISNMEYGWSGNVINRALLDSSINVNQSQPQTQSSHTRNASSGAHPRPSIQSSIRSSFEASGAGSGSSRARLPGDRIQILEWQPPQQSLMPSALLEVDQLKALTNYVKNVEEELSKHNELRSAMLLAYTPRHPNASKSMGNWEKKSSYLLREIVKFRTYIDALKAAEVRRDEVYKQRGDDEAVKNASAADDTSTTAAVAKGGDSLASSISGSGIGIGIGNGLDIDVDGGPGPATITNSEVSITSSNMSTGARN